MIEASVGAGLVSSVCRRSSWYGHVRLTGLSGAVADGGRGGRCVNAREGVAGVRPGARSPWRDDGAGRKSGKVPFRVFFWRSHARATGWTSNPEMPSGAAARNGRGGSSRYGQGAEAAQGADSRHGYTPLVSCTQHRTRVRTAKRTSTSRATARPHQ